ncbi:MAG TPA: hypothetical protein VFW79_11280 [Cellulomonas sp.]|uniref:hypothetical protein n=1 Tax=Cellulomonas sp. TaxID=40001 RepID=UPI002E2F0D46|nr:hypothetical protein [Cellulomonas sp.]HEX5333214.1 hypothetical protein [Cellulomonas sp.]
MDVVLRIVVGLLLLAHGLVHLLYFVTSPDDPKFPFTITSSWLVPEPARRPVATVLVAVTIVAFALLGLTVWGVPGLLAIWPLLAVVGSVASLAVLIAFWDAQLLLGVAIDVAAIVIAVARPGWTSWISGR